MLNGILHQWLQYQTWDQRNIRTTGNIKLQLQSAAKPNLFNIQIEL